MSDFALETEITAKDQLSEQMRRAANASAGYIERAAGRMNAGLRTVTQTTRRIGRAATYASSRVAVAAGAATAATAVAVDRARDYEVQLARVNNVLGDGKDAFKLYEDDVKRIAVTYAPAEDATESLSQTVAALYESLSAGVGDAEVVDYVELMAKAAKAAGGDIVDLAGGVASLRKNFDETDEALASGLARVEALGRVNAAEAARLSGPLAASLKASKVGWEEWSASLATATAAGLEGTAVQAGMRGVLQNMAKPTADARKEARRLGVDFSAASLEANGFTGTINALFDALDRGGKADSVAKLFGDQEARTFFQTLRGSREEYGRARDSIAGASDEIQKNYENVARTQGQTLDQMKAGLALFAVEAGGGFAEGIGLDDMEDLPQLALQAGAGVRKGMRDLASGFREAFDAADDLQEFDWGALGSSMGTAFSIAGSAISGYVGLVNDGYAAVQRLWSFMRDEMPGIVNGEAADVDEQARKRGRVVIPLHQSPMERLKEQMAPGALLDLVGDEVMKSVFRGELDSLAMGKRIAERIGNKGRMATAAQMELLRDGRLARTRQEAARAGSSRMLDNAYGVAKQSLDGVIRILVEGKDGASAEVLESRMSGDVKLMSLPDQGQTLVGVE